ncbi:MAG: oxidoreductase [Desulfobacterales bacterium]|jgi:NAD(P)-dependent dehydrogenase (short-subunit alcohol dehydrogenase family)|nr:oxidoreductase [Desulfobacterales bacterium]
MSKVWFITGATRGIGAEIARAALLAGNKVVATGRKPENATRALGVSTDLLVAALDVTRQEQIQSAVQAAKKRFGRIDILVNNAGYGQLGVFEEIPLEAIRAQYDTNVFGLMAVTHAVIPGMRQQRSGRIFNISSVGGLKGFFGGSIYNSSKFAIEGFSQSIAEELAPFGVFVTAISPGYFRTDFLDSRSVKYADVTISDYAQASEDFRAFQGHHHLNQTGDPAKLAEAILRLAEVNNPPVSFVAGSDGIKWAMKAIRTLQEQIDNWRELSVSTDGMWE